MKDQSLYTQIETDTFDTEVLLEKRPVLLAFISRDYAYMQQTRLLDDLSRAHGQGLKICLVKEDFIGSFMRFGVEGSPAFILFHKGKEKGRMLGKADEQSLSAFLCRSIPDLSVQRA